MQKGRRQHARRVGRDSGIGRNRDRGGTGGAQGAGTGAQAKGCPENEYGTQILNIPNIPI